MARALVLLAAGAEEMETTIVVDVLRRASVEVVLAGVDGEGPVTCSRGVRLVPDSGLDAVLHAPPFDAIVLPGGAGGARRLAESAAVGQLLQRHWEQGRLVAAVCAAPTALAAHGIALGQTLTCHPGVRAELQASYELSDERVVQDGRLVTSQGPGTSFEFALHLVAQLQGYDAMERVRAPMVL